MTTLPPKPVVVRIIATGYYIPSVLIGLWVTKYGPMAWIPAAQSRN